MPHFPDRYVITGLIAEDAPGLSEKKGDRVWLYWTDEAGGWWQWGPKGWAKRFVAPEGAKYEDAIRCAPKAGPWYCRVDPATVETRAVPAIVIGR